MGLGELRRLLAYDRPQALLVVDDVQRVYGYVTPADVLKATIDGKSNACAADIAHACENVILPHASLERALKMMAVEKQEYLPVVDDVHERRLTGVIFHRDLVQAHNRALLEARAQERGDI